jgi:hypothetical protein
MALTSTRKDDPGAHDAAPGSLEALIEEARRRQRRRYRRMGAAVLVCVVALTLGLVWIGGSGHRSPTTSGTQSARPPLNHNRVRSLRIAGPFSPSQILTAAAMVWLVGSVPTRIDPSRCAIESVNPTTLQRRLYPGPACGPDVAVGGSQIYLTDVTYVGDSNDEQIRIERFDTVTRHATVLAPVDMTLVGSSIAHTSMIYDDGSLWLWGYGAPGGPGTGRDEVVQISAASGAVLRTVTGVPDIGGIQPSMVVAAGGLWLSGGAGGGNTVDRITPTASAPTVVYAAPSNSSVLWLAAVGGRIWAEEVTAGPHPGTHLVAPSANGHRILGTTPSHQNFAETAAVGTGSQLWAIGAGESCRAPLRLWRIDAATGDAESILTLLSSGEPCDANARVAVSGRRVFALVSGVPASTVLYRVSV